jgi:hypothetical protein
MNYVKFSDIKVGEYFMSKDMERAFKKTSDLGYFLAFLNAERVSDNDGDNRVFIPPTTTVVKIIEEDDRTNWSV